MRKRVYVLLLTATAPASCGLIIDDFVPPPHHPASWAAESGVLPARTRALDPELTRVTPSVGDVPAPAAPAPQTGGGHGHH